ncbi:MAG: hypothetical protein ACXVKO_12795, partial [Bacteriovorax sp.]
MNKLQFTVHLRSSCAIKKFKFNLLLALFGPVFFLLAKPLYAEVKIALIDTGFCPEKIQDNIKIEPTIDFTKSVKLDCFKSDTHLPRFHGQLVLEEFLKFLDFKKIKVHLYPLMIFDIRGDQKKEYWIEAIDWVKKNKIDFVLTASGLITNEKIENVLPAIWFVPSGRASPGIADKSALFPQNLAPQENLFLIGDYYDGKQVLYDQALLYKDKIDYYFPSGLKGFKGTSRAVAEAAARALNLCPISSMRACLKKLSKEYVDNL